MSVRNYIENAKDQANQNYMSWDGNNGNRSNGNNYRNLVGFSGAGGGVGGRTQYADGGGNNSDNEVGIIIYEDQSFTTYQLTNNVSKSDKVLGVSIPHIKIPLTSFIKKFIDDEQKTKFLQPTGLITDQEMQVLTALRQQNLSSITIQFDAEKNIKKIESAKTGFIHGDDAKEIMHILGMNNYTGIEMYTRDGKTLSFTHTRKNYMA